MCNCIHPIHSVATESSFACNISIYLHHKCISIFFYVMDWAVLLNQGCMHVEWKHLTCQTAHFIPVIRERIWGQKTWCQVRCRWSLLGGSATPRSRRNQVPTPTPCYCQLVRGMLGYHTVGFITSSIYNHFKSFRYYHWNHDGGDWATLRNKCHSNYYIGSAMPIANIGRVLRDNSVRHAHAWQKAPWDPPQTSHSWCA